MRTHGLHIRKHLVQQRWYIQPSASKDKRVEQGRAWEQRRSAWKQHRMDLRQARVAPRCRPARLPQSTGAVEAEAPGTPMLCISAMGRVVTSTKGISSEREVGALRVLWAGASWEPSGGLLGDSGSLVGAFWATPRGLLAPSWGPLGAKTANQKFA